MKKIMIMFVICIFSSCNNENKINSPKSADNEEKEIIQSSEPISNISSKEIFDTLSKNGLPIGEVFNIDKEVDPELLYNQNLTYSEKVIWMDERHLFDKYYFNRGGIIEIYNNIEDVESRLEFIQKFEKENSEEELLTKYGYIKAGYRFTYKNAIIEFSNVISKEEYNQYIEAITKNKKFEINVPKYENIQYYDDKELLFNNILYKINNIQESNIHNFYVSSFGRKRCIMDITIENKSNKIFVTNTTLDYSIEENGKEIMDISPLFLKTSTQPYYEIKIAPGKSVNGKISFEAQETEKIFTLKVIQDLFDKKTLKFDSNNAKLIIYN